jgi:hypothetical protein
MHKYSRVAAALMAVTLIATVLVPAVISAQDTEEERFRAIAVVMGNVATGRNSNIDIVITRWTTPEEREALLTVLMTEDQNKFREALTKQEMTGWMRLPNTLRQEFRYCWVRSQRDDGSREIIIATDRIIPFVEAWNQPRSFDYDITLIEMELDENNEGSGIAAVGIKFKVDGNNLTIENFGTQPVNLNRIRRTN